MAGKYEDPAGDVSREGKEGKVCKAGSPSLLWVTLWRKVEFGDVRKYNIHLIIAESAGKYQGKTAVNVEAVDGVPVPFISRD